MGFRFEYRRGCNLRGFAIAVSASLFTPLWGAVQADPVNEFRTSIQPILTQYCFDCHADGVNKGQVALDQFKSDADITKNPELWWKVLKNVRSGLMPPQKKARPDDREKQRLFTWIKYGAFGIDPANPDPGRLSIRRLNRAEYRNTIRALTGIDFNTTEEFPPDDTGYGFDTIGDVLTVSPMLLEKYMQAADVILNSAVPTVSKVVAQTRFAATDLHAIAVAKADDAEPAVADAADADATGAEAQPADKTASVKPPSDKKRPTKAIAEKTPTDGSRMTYYMPANVGTSFNAKIAGDYRVVLNLVIHGAFDFDPGRCELALKIDDVEQWRQPFKWDYGKNFRYEVPIHWEPGEHHLAIELHPLVPVEKKRTSVDMEVKSLDVQGPLNRKFWVAPDNYHRFFPHDDAPEAPEARRAYAREVLAAFAKKAFRRPAPPAVVDRLVTIAEAGYSQDGKRFEDGIRSAMLAILSSPRFLFRVEQGMPAADGASSTLVDEYSLASRLSYFLWSSMPDDELTSLADQGKLRENLPAQVRRMLKDARSEALVRNFAGQWLQLRDVESVPINARVVLSQDSATTRPTTQASTARRGFGFGRAAIELDLPLRDAMRREPEMLFDEIIREDKSVTELLQTDHTYVNEALAKVYKISGITGTQMRRVKLPKDSPRGGLLTMGAFLTVTSNPTRTSPVKRGQFILDNILGMPAPAPPPDIPPLEDAEKNAGHALSFRESLEVHRNKALCRSCHARMDPLGLSLENFNALGVFREQERGFPIDATGQLITGESFHDARDVKAIIVGKHRSDFYRCLTEKMLTYALGRGLDYRDVEAVDQIVSRLDAHDGHFSELLNGIVESAPFQRRRVAAPTNRANSAVQARGPDPALAPKERTP